MVGYLCEALRHRLEPLLESPGESMNSLLLTGAGGGGSNNLMRALLASSAPPRLIGVNADAFCLARSRAERNYKIPHSSERLHYITALNRIGEEESVDLLIPTNDTEVGILSQERDSLKIPVLLPSSEAVEICQDKARFGDFMGRAGIPVPRAQVVRSLDDVDDIFRSWHNPQCVWLRLRRGNGSRGTLPVQSPEQAKHWIQYWNQMRGVSIDDFVINEFLPGRDFAFMGIWKHGQCIIGKIAERLKYLFGANIPSGTMSTPSLATLTRQEEVLDVCLKSVACLEEKPHGIYSIDLKCDAQGAPKITEINIGRFFRISPIFNFAGKHNLATVYLRLALGQEIEIPEQERFHDIGEEPVYWICDIDDTPSVLTHSELLRRYTEFKV